jgi:DNA-binding MarR family transcriptional regulator
LGGGVLHSIYAGSGGFLKVETLELIRRLFLSYNKEPMEWLNYHHLLYFWTVARTGNISNASKELLLAPPTISAQVSRLEDTLGEKLFARSGRRLVLTEAGRVVFRYAEDIFGLGRELMDRLKGSSYGAAAPGADWCLLTYSPN